MIVYIDNNYKCYIEPAEGLRAFEVPELDSKCPAYITGTRYVPAGETWTRSDGEIFKGEMIAPCIDSRIREAYQQQYEESQQTINEYEAALTAIEEALGV